MKLWILTLVLGLAVIALGVGYWHERGAGQELAAQVAKLTQQNAGLNHDLKQAVKQAADVGKRAVELDSQLGSAKSRTTATESRQAQLNRELNETKSRLTEREQREIALMAELATLRQKVTEAGAPAGPVVTAPAPAVVASAPATTQAAPTEPAEPAVDVAAYNRRIDELEQQLTALLTRALTEPATPAPAAAPEPAPARPVSHHVVRVGARDSFVVIDYGTDHGARANDIISVQHGTSEVARVQISDARPRFSVAQVLPDSVKGQLQSGDLVVFKN